MSICAEIDEIFVYISILTNNGLSSPREVNELVIQYSLEIMGTLDDLSGIDLI